MIVKYDGFLFMEGNDSICFFQKLPKDINGKYSRCNYIHPLYGPNGNRLTEDFPADHLHHRGVFWAWHQLIIGGKQVSDGWELKNFEQKVTNFEFRQLKGKGYIQTSVDWKSPLWREGTEAYIREESKIIIYPKTKTYRRYDFEIKLNALTDDLSIGGSDDEKGYSGFSVRVKLPEDVAFWSENGLVEPMVTAIESGNAMKMSGSFLKNGGKGGVVMWSDPSNPEPSKSWIIRKKASMQNAAYPGRKQVAIPMDKPLVLKYSVLVYKGDLSMKQIKKAVKL